MIKFCRITEINYDHITVRNMKRICYTHEGVSRRFQTGCLEQELQMVQLSATRCSCIAIM